MDGHNDGLTDQEAERRREEYGFNEIKDRSKKWPELLWDQLYGDHWYPNPIPGMMWCAIIVCFAIQDFADGGVVLFLHMFNSSLGFYETMKAGDAVAALKGALAPVCNVKRNGEWKRIQARELVPGDLVMLKIGDVVPADGVLEPDSSGKGSCDLDQSGLTGESLPVKKVAGDTVYSGTVVKRGEQDMIVTHTGEKTEMGKGVALIQSVDSKGQVEVIMNRITLVLVVFAVTMNVLLVIVEVTVPATINICGPAGQVKGCYPNKASKILSNFVVLMVSAIPIATPVVVTATMAIGARKMAQCNAVVTKLSAIEELAGMTVLCSDKTGTLTKNVLTIDDPYMMPGFEWEDMIFKSGLAAKAVDPDAIDKVIRDYIKDQARLNSYVELDFLPFDPVAKRTESTMKAPDGEIVKVTKGAPQVICDMAWNSDAIRDEVKKGMMAFAEKGLRPVATAEWKDNKWHFMGMMSLFDPPRDDSHIVIESAIKLGASVKMITGDHLLIAKETCRRLGMGDAILGTDELQKPEEILLNTIEDCDGFAEVMPEDKFNIVAAFQKKGHITGMTGDGVNDAPALRKANVGFAVEGATAAAQGAADCILLTPGLSVIITAIERSRKIFQRLQNYLIYRVFMSVYLLVFFFVAIAWADFDFPPLIIIFMCLILDLSMMSLAYDKVVPSALPNKWNLTKIVGIAIALALVASGGSLIFLSFMRNNSFGMSVWQRGMPTSCNSAYATYTANSSYITPENSYGLSFTDIGQVWTGDDDPGQGGCTGKHYKVFHNLSMGPNPQIAYPLPTSQAHLNCPNNVASMDPECGTIAFKTLLNPSNGGPGTGATPAVYYYPPGINRIPHEGYPYGYINSSSPSTNMLGYSCESGETALFDPRNFPYSSAVENSVMFLQLSLSSLFTVLSARVDGWFFIRRPGYVLLGIISTVMVVITITVGVMRPFPFWYPNTEYQAVRLTAVDGKYIGVAWLYSIVLFLVMECAKWVVYKAIELARTNEIAARKRMKLKEELRRRMTRKTPGFQQTEGMRGSSVSNSNGLAPRAVGSVSRGSISTKVINTQYEGGDLNAPLLDEQYAG